VALKIIKNVDKYRDSAKLEINVLQTINERDPKGEKSVCHMFLFVTSALLIAATVK
jgi:dual specificity protein kinase CLK2/3